MSPLVIVTLPDHTATDEAAASNAIAAKCYRKTRPPGLEVPQN